jgi:hypothetical protein
LAARQLLLFVAERREVMSGQGRKNVRIVNSPELERAGLRPWRDPPEQEGRDLRPGHFSVTGEFIQLPEREEASRAETDQRRLA